jgi:hypothetical protein
MPPPLFFLSQPDVLLKVREAGVRAWLYVTAFLASNASQVPISTAQVDSPYLLGLGRFFLFCSTVTSMILNSNGTFRHCGYHRVSLYPHGHNTSTKQNLS